MLRFDEKAHWLIRNGRLIFHIAVAFVGWALFIYLWYVTLTTRITGPRPLYELFAIFLVGLLIAAITASWVLHNLKIWRKKGPRRKIPRVDYDFSKDYLKRTVVADWEELKDADTIEIIVRQETKEYKSLKPTGDERA